MQLPETTYSVWTAVDYIMSKAAERGIADITNLKLQKLLYFAQGFVLASREQPLFEERIEAWTYGPVVPEVYRRFKAWGSSVLEGGYCTGKPEIEKSVQERINDMLDRVGGLSANRLLAITHREDSPWYNTWRNGKGRCDVIPISDIREYFIEMLAPTT